MREILFKAKRLDNGEWVEGVPVDVTPLVCFAGEENREVIMIRAGFADFGMPRPIEGARVDPETVCQFTGLTDKNGVKIFEGDVVLVSEKRRHKTKAMFDSGNARFVLDINQPDDTSLYMCKEAEDEYEVIGNIHDEVTP